MIKKLIVLLSFFLIVQNAYAFFWDKKEKPSLFLSANDPRISRNGETVLENSSVFYKNRKIYYLIYNPEGFKSDYIKIQIIKQDDKAHVGGYSRIRNINKRIKDKHYYIDYFVISESGKYIIQIFDIENIHHWITYGQFLVKDD